MSTSITHTDPWKHLLQHKREWNTHTLQNLFQEDPKRFEDLHYTHEGLFVDVSKAHITLETLSLLISLARHQKLESTREQLFSGETLNHTEGRAAIHTQLRQTPFSSTVQEALDKIKHVSASIRSGNWGTQNTSIRHIVHIGIGGSDLGPKMLCHALKGTDQVSANISIDFVSGYDEQRNQEIQAKCDANSTLVIVSSKSFSTKETLLNAESFKSWMTKDQWHNQAIAITSHAGAAQFLEFTEDNILTFDEGVGGRYSLWSSIGLPIAIMIGFDGFVSLLKGAASMDTHFEEAPLEKNIPVILGLIELWYRNFWNVSAFALIPYSQKLLWFPHYIQQLSMESNGKSITNQGDSITDYQTAPVIFGQIATECQHSFFQKLHQGTQQIPIEFIGCINDEGNNESNHFNLTNMLAQSQALMQGNSEKTKDSAYQTCIGNKPSTSILLEQIDPYHMGMLVALYEHKTFVQGICWDINSFDQFGVELGKEMAKKIQEGQQDNLDPSTMGILHYIQDKRSDSAES